MDVEDDVASIDDNVGVEMRSDDDLMTGGAGSSGAGGDGDVH